MPKLHLNSTCIAGPPFHDFSFTDLLPTEWRKYLHECIGSAMISLAMPCAYIATLFCDHSMLKIQVPFQEKELVWTSNFVSLAECQESCTSHGWLFQRHADALELWNEWYCIFWDEDRSVINVHLWLCKCVLRSCFVWNTCSDVIPVDEISDIEMAWPRNAAILLSMHSLFWRETEGRKQQYSVSSLVGFRQGLSASQQYFPLTTNQHQPNLSA